MHNYCEGFYSKFGNLRYWPIKERIWKKYLQYKKVTSRYYPFIGLNFNSFNISFVAILDHSNLDDINYTPFIGLLICQEFLWENAD